MNPAPQSDAPSPAPPRASAPDAPSRSGTIHSAPQDHTSSATPPLGSLRHASRIGVPHPSPGTIAPGPAPRTGTPGEARGAGVPGFRADTEALRGDATAVSDFAIRVSAAASRVPTVVPAPRWATTGAAIGAADTARRLLSALAEDITETADRIRAVAVDYEEADVRAATRLRSPR